MDREAIVKRTSEMILTAGVAFDLYLPKHPEAQPAQVSINDFFGWLLGHTEEGPTFEEACAACAAKSIPDEWWNELKAMPENPGIYVQFASLWDQVRLKDRGALQHELASVHFVALLRWEDGRITPLSNFVPRELVNLDGTYTDGSLCTMLRHAGNVLASLIVGSGADNLHDQQSYYISDRVMQLMAQAIQAAIPNMHLSAQGQMQQLLDICFSYVNPPIRDPQAIALIQQKRAARGANKSTAEIEAEIQRLQQLKEQAVAAQEFDQAMEYRNQIAALQTQLQPKPQVLGGGWQ